MLLSKIYRFFYSLALSWAHIVYSASMKCISASDWLLTILECRVSITFISAGLLLGLQNISFNLDRTFSSSLFVVFDYLY
jgi:hypothetical protein